MRASDFVGLVGDREAENSHPACPDSHRVIVSSDGVMRDEAGHGVEMLHTAYVLRLQRAVQLILTLHRPDHEGIVSRCVHDGLVYPCPSKQAVSW